MCRFRRSTVFAEIVFIMRSSSRLRFILEGQWRSGSVSDRGLSAEFSREEEPNPEMIG